MRKAWVCAQIAVLSAALIGREAATDPTNYQRYVIGERALGMGGAQTAAVNDPMANLYNPAAMVFTESTMVSASKCLYSFDSRKIEGGFIPASSFSTAGADAVTLEQKNDLTLPSTLAISTKFGKKLEKSGSKRHAIGIAIMVPNQDKFTLRGSWKAGGDLRDSETYSLSESFTQIWMGLSYALRVIDELGLGVSAFLSTTSFERNMVRSRYASFECATSVLDNCGHMEFRESALSIDTVSLVFRVGALWEPHPNWRFGLMVTAPSILIPDLKLFTTKGSLSQTYGTAYVEGYDETNPTDYFDTVEYFGDSYDLKVKVQEPMSFRAGAAYLWRDMFAADFDVSLYLPTHYQRIAGDPVKERRCPGWGGICDDAPAEIVNESASPYWFDEGIMKSIDRRAVVNFNLGWELILKEMWTIRNGLFTDFSSAPIVTESLYPQQTRINRYGASVAFGFKAKGYDISIGVTGSLGSGYASVNDSNMAYPWQPAQATERALYVFLAGVQAAAVKGSKTIVKKAEEKIKEKKTEEATADEADGEERGTQEGEAGAQPVAPAAGGV